MPRHLSRLVMIMGVVAAITVIGTAVALHRTDLAALDNISQVIGAFISAISLGLTIKNRSESGLTMRAGVLRAAAAALPHAMRDRYVEEWRGELYDLRAEGARWWRRVAHLLGLVRGCARLAVIARRDQQKAVD